MTSISKYMTSIPKNVHVNKFEKVVNKYDNTYHRATKMKSADVNPSMYIDFNKENNNKSPKFKIGDHVKMSKYKNIFPKGDVSNWYEEVSVIKKVKNTVLWTSYY